MKILLIASKYISDSLSEIGEFDNAILYLENTIGQEKNKQFKKKRAS